MGFWPYTTEERLQIKFLHPQYDAASESGSCSVSHDKSQTYFFYFLNDSDSISQGNLSMVSARSLNFSHA